MFERARNSLLLGMSLLAGLACAPIAWAQQGPTPGQNVNMVSGTKWPGGDPFLERQNEPSIAVSTRNPLHLLAGANDYRSVDLNLVDQLPINELAGDAWLGVFKSFDGNRWQSTLLPGFPQDQSSFGAASPMKGFLAASDPVVRAGTNGMFYYGGIAFNRPSNVGGLFMARFIDLNDKENGDATQSCSPGQPCIPAPTTDPIRYIGTVKIDSGTAGQFLDKPWVAVDIPRGGAGTCNIQATQPVVQSDGTVVNQIVNQTFPAGNIYVAYAMFVGGVINVRSKINFAKSSDCGATWAKPIIISQTFNINQAPSIAIDPLTGYMYVAWRVFSSGNDPDAIVVAKSTDGGNTFTKAVQAQALQPFNAATPSAPAFFDLATSGTSFRSNAFPAMAADDKGTLYMAWSQRGQGPMGEARIMMSTSLDGVIWSSPRQVDPGAITDDAPGDSFSHGHQFMPSLTFIEGKLMVLYYDQRLDHSVGNFDPVTQGGTFVPDAEGKFFHESRPLEGELAMGNFSSVFTPFIDDANPPLSLRRHTIDVTLAQSDGGANPSFTYARVAQYDFGLLFGETATTFHQLKVNPPGLPMFMHGQVPFMGDYIDIAGQMFVTCAPTSPTCPNGWAYNNPAANPSSPVHYATWTTNQDVVPPINGDWTTYIPITSGTSVFDGSTTPACQPGKGFEGDRNQNIYESRITQGLLVSSPQNSKPLSTTVQRAFVVLVQNSTNSQKSFRLMIANQPPGSFAITGQANVGGFASFQQALPNQPALPNPLPAPVRTQDVATAAHSGVASTVFALSNSPTASMTVNVNELDQSGNVLSGGLSGSIVLNADGTVPPLTNPEGAPANTNITGVEIYDPGVTGPGVTGANATGTNITSPGVTGPGVTGSTCAAPGVTGPGVTGTGCVAPGVTGPGVTGPGVTGPGVTGSTVVNPGVTGNNVPAPGVTGSAVSDASYTVSNIGNTNAEYQVKLAGCDSSPCKDTPLQLVLSQIYTTPGTDGQCNLIPVQQNILLSNVAQPKFTPVSQLSSPGVTGGAVSNPTISLAPGDSAVITLRGFVDTATMRNIVTQVAPAIVPQAIDTNSTAITPPVIAPLFIATSALADAVTGASYNATVQAIGGTPPYNWSISAGNLPVGDGFNPPLMLNATTGLISGIPGCPPNAFCIFPATYNFTVQITDSASPANMTTRQLSIRVARPLMITTASPLATGTQGASYGPITLTAGGGTAPYSWTPVTVNGISLSNSGVVSGTPTTNGPFSLTAQVSDSGSPPQAASSTITFSVIGPAAGLTFSTQPISGAGGVLFNVAVQVMDNFGAVIPAVNVTLAIQNNPSGGTLSPAPGKSLTVMTDAIGIATFSVSIDRGATALGCPANGYTLIANISGGPSLVSNCFGIAGFAPTMGAMGAGRISPTATLLNNGKVLVTGGGIGGVISDVTTLNTAELYDPATKTFASTGNMNAHRYGHTATLLQDGTVLVVGGSTIVSAEIYNPGTGIFTPTTGAPNFQRFFHSATLLNDGTVLIAGGSPSLLGEIYNPATGTFSTTTGSMTAARSFHAATPLNNCCTLTGNGLVLLSGGSGSSGVQSTSEYYDPETKTFTSTSTLLSSTRELQTATLINGNVYVFGGTPDGLNGLASADFFNSNTLNVLVSPWLFEGFNTAAVTQQVGGPPVASTFTLNSTAWISEIETYHFNGGAGDVPGTITLQAAGGGIFGPFAAQGFSSASTPSNPGTAFVASVNLPIGPGTFTVQDSVPNTWSFNNASNNRGFIRVTGTFTPPQFSLVFPTLNVARAYHTATLLPSNSVLVAGGQGGAATPNLASAEIFNPGSNSNPSFTVTGSLVTARRSHATVLLSDGTVFVVGGNGNSGPLQSAEIFYPQ